MKIVTVERKVLEKNDEYAARNRETFHRHGVFVVNLMSSPGSGKTSVLESMLKHWAGRISAAVIEGDVQTDLDAQRIAAFHIPVVQIVTNGGCHLDASLVQKALTGISLQGLQLLVIENVGNLVCPANYDLGEDMKVVVASTTEGDDKPLKYPALYRTASALLLNKIDLLPYVPCRPAEWKANALRINPALRLFEISCTTQHGMKEWCAWVEQQASRAQMK